MRLPRPRLTIRRLMLAVAIVAIAALAIFVLARLMVRRGRFLERAEYHNRLLMNLMPRGDFEGDMPLEIRLKVLRGLTVQVVRSAEDESKTTDRGVLMILYHQDMRNKWDNAARYPWLPVPPDPPEPE